MPDDVSTEALVLSLFGKLVKGGCWNTWADGWRLVLEGKTNEVTEEEIDAFLRWAPATRSTIV